MKILSNSILLFVALMLFTGNSKAQQNISKIKGFVFNAQNEPAAYSTIILMNKDSVFMKGALSNPDGSYLIDKVAPGNYLVMVRNIEFKRWVSSLIKIGVNETIELEKIKLETNVTALKGVVVVGKKPVIEVLPDKIVYNISQSINTSGNNGIEAISKAPGIIVDMDNNIILQGKSGVQVHINGRPSKLSGSDLANMLEGMRSDNIESIEVITNPSSKYDAEGTGGIINIILKKNINLGMNGNVITSYSKGTFARGSVGSTINYSANKLLFNANITATESNFQDDIVDITKQSGFILDKKSYSVNNRQGYNFSSGFDYKFNAKHSAGADAKVFINDRSNDLQSSTGIFDSADVIPGEILMAETQDKIPTQNYVLNLNYRMIPSDKSNLSLDFSLGRYISSKDTEQPNTYFDVDMTNLLRSNESQYNSNTGINLWTSMLEYEKKFKNLTIITGAKYSFVSSNNQLAFYDIVSDIPVLNINRSNDFTYQENVAAAYLTMSAKPTPKFTFNLGVRMESTSSLGQLDSEIAIDDSEVPQSYTDFFPNVGISYDNQKKSVVSLSVGRRITRPNYQDLNPFESRNSELSAWKGNPFLKPNYISNYQLTYSFNRKLVISNTYSVTRDFFANIFIITADKGNIITPRNMQKAINNGLSITYPIKFAKWWDLSSFAVYNYSKYDGNLDGTIIDLESDNYNLRFQNNLKLPLGISMEVTYFYNSRSIWRGSINVKSFSGLNVGLKKDFLNRKFLVQITGNDIFNGSSDYYYSSDYGGMVIKGVRSFDSRRFGFNLTYNFGNQKAKAKSERKSSSDNELNRITE